MGDGAWIFLSHSQKDWDQVRKVRNILEDKGQNPLIFFLKCMRDDSALADLIVQEIRARRWFILCDSPNAQKSKWVTQERNVIEDLPKNKYTSCTINLAAPIEQQLETLSPFLKKATVYLSYSNTERDWAIKIADALREEDFGVFFPSEPTSGQDGVTETNNAIGEASTKGALLFLFSQDSKQKQRQATELIAFMIKSAASMQLPNIIPIFLDSPNNLNLPIGIPPEITGVDFSTGEFTDNMNKVMEKLWTFGP